MGTENRSGQAQFLGREGTRWLMGTWVGRELLLLWSGAGAPATEYPGETQKNCRRDVENAVMHNNTDLQGQEARDWMGPRVSHGMTMETKDIGD